MNPTVKHIESLTTAERAAMHALLASCFDGASREQFDADLSNKTLVVLLRDDADCVKGFSTLAMFHDTDPSGDDVTIACSGDSIVAPDAWGSSALPRAWINAALAWHDQHGRGPLYWLLITSGFRTYRFLPVFFREFHPHHACDTPASVAAWMHGLAARRWPHEYDRVSGLVRFDNPQRLRGWLSQVPDTRQVDPHIAHFLRLNPGHADGDELVCLCELSTGNLTRAGRRMLQAGRARSDSHAVEFKA